MHRTCNLRLILVVLAGVFCLAAASIPAQPPPEPEWAPVVKRLSDEDVPVAMRLSTFVSHMDKMAKGNRENAKRFLGGFGLEADELGLDLLNELYGDFDEDQGERHGKMLREVGNRPEVIERKSRRFVLERASFAGGVLGAWLAQLRDKGQNTDAFLRNVADDYSVSAFWGGRPPTLERLDQESRAFETSFAAEYGEPLPSVLQAGAEGGAR